MKAIQREIYKIKSNSEEGKVYTVEVLFNHIYLCTCTSFMMRGVCRHTDEVKMERYLRSFKK